MGVDQRLQIWQFSSTCPLQMAPRSTSLLHQPLNHLSSTSLTVSLIGILFFSEGVCVEALMNREMLYSCEKSTPNILAYAMPPRVCDLPSQHTGDVLIGRGRPRWLERLSAGQYHFVVAHNALRRVYPCFIEIEVSFFVLSISCSDVQHDLEAKGNSPEARIILKASRVALRFTIEPAEVKESLGISSGITSLKHM